MACLYERARQLEMTCQNKITISRATRPRASRAAAKQGYALVSALSGREAIAGRLPGRTQWSYIATMCEPQNYEPPEVRVCTYELCFIGGECDNGPGETLDRG